MWKTVEQINGYIKVIFLCVFIFFAVSASQASLLFCFLEVKDKSIWAK